MLKLSVKCYEERYQNPLGGNEQELIIKAALNCYKDIFNSSPSLAVTFFTDISEFCMRIVQNDDIKLL